VAAAPAIAAENGDDGVVWEITAAGDYKVLHNFGGPVVDL
jgi:hypothetical protein